MFSATRWLLAVSTCGLAAQMAAQAGSPVATTTGIGVQIYTCAETGKWVFTAPEATLYVERDKVGEHGSGPRWTWADGSAVTGKVTATTPASEPDKNIPSLELLATAVPGAANGVLTPVTRVTRTETQGGVAPATGCEVKGETLRVPYVAVYRFFTK